MSGRKTSPIARFFWVGQISIWRFILIPKFNSGLQPSLPRISPPLLSCDQCLCPHRPLWKPAIKLIPGWHPRARKKKRWISPKAKILCIKRHYPPLKRDTTPWVNKQLTDWEKISANHVSDKKQLNNKETK